MAVLDPKKLLPQTKKESKKSSAPNATRFLVPVKNVQYKASAVIPTPKDDTKSETSDYIKKEVYVIKEKVISIEEILKKSLSIKQKSLDKKYKDIENRKRRQREDLLEQKPKQKLPGVPTVQAPRLSFLEKLKNFITYTLLGFVVMKLWKHLPQILKFTKLIGPAVTFFDSFVGGLADKLITFIDWGYKAYDKVRELTKKIGGDPFQKTFDDFSGKLNTFINLAIIAGMSTMGGTDFGLGKKGKPRIASKPGKPGTPSQTNTNLSNYLNRSKEAKLVERKFGNNAAKYYEQLRESGKNSAQAFNEVKRRFQPRGLFNRQNIGGLAGEGQTAGQVGRRGLGRTANRFAAKTFGKSGAKIASGASKALGRFPIIGPLVDFAFRYFVLREPLGKATAGAVGAGVGQALGTWLGGAVGGVAGSVVPIVGNLIGAGAGAAIGGILGGLIGDQLGVSLYETITAYQKPEKIQGRAEGGQVTRGGRTVGGPVKRSLTLRRKKPKPPRLKAPDVKIGKDISGGKKLIEKVFNPEDSSKPKQVSSLRTLTNISKVLKGTNTNFFSQIAGVGIDLAMGQKPSKGFIKQFGSAFGGILQELIDTNAEMSAMETARSILAMANGGMVPETMVTRGGNFGQKVGEAVSNMFQSFIDNQSSMIISLLREESNKEPISGTTGPSTTQPGATSGELAAGTLARGQITIEQLIGLAKGAGFSDSDAVIMAAIAMAESGGNSNAHNNKPPDNSYGLWQINMIGALGPARLKEIGISNNEQLFDPVVNAHAAKLIKRSQGWGAWTVYKTGAYKTHLAAAQRASSSPAITVYRPGTAGPGGFVPLGNMSGNLSAAQQLAASMGLQTTSTTHWSDGRRRSGLHGAGRAMDFSNDGVGNGTPQQLAFAKAMVQKYGSSLEQLIYTPLGFGIANGKRVGLDYWGASTNAQHYNHVHVAFKRGGYTGSGGVARLHGNEFVMNANAVKFFGRETFEAMNAIGDKSAKYISAKLSRSKNIKVANNIDQQTSYEKNHGMTVVILPLEKTTPSRTQMPRSNTMINMGNSSIDNTMHGALA